MQIVFADAVLTLVIAAHPVEKRLCCVLVIIRNMEGLLEALSFPRSWEQEGGQSWIRGCPLLTSIQVAQVAQRTRLRGRGNGFLGRRQNSASPVTGLCPSIPNGMAMEMLEAVNLGGCSTCC
ncbi:uncharacterized protein LY89DRAFT_681642 [Mollisia scopiformis]|uniref:Secreted protein n=1 Tax=Mollisia scopiformis TaxID=149040 RepID=A0A194XL97_MOLSC|nr:uncharacterized protein LY89DRAFT_681642 [Mollisia scopiformis]KUJ21010.1 hypothetical protein LY89DRAFT_681642 [Mollisia scopiformis]